MDSDGEIKPASKWTQYQKRIAATENVILCVAEAEKMVNAIGQSLLLGPESTPNYPEEIGADTPAPQAAEEEDDPLHRSPHTGSRGLAPKKPHNEI